MTHFHLFQIAERGLHWISRFPASFAVMYIAAIPGSLLAFQIDLADNVHIDEEKVSFH